MNDFINNLVLKHILGEPGVVGFGVLVLTQIDHVIFFALKFFRKATIEDWADRLDAMIKARIEKDADAPAPPPAKP